MRILLVEDDAQLGKGICIGLKQAGYVVDWLTEGAGVVQALKQESFDLMILDLGLPGIDGMDLLRDVRDKRISLPVLILTARDSTTDRVMGLDLGADDYMVKPFELEELYARLRALLRRNTGRASPLIEYGDLALDPADRSVRLKGELVSLTPREFYVIHLLLENVGRVMSREKLEESIHGWDEGADSNAIEVHIHRLRKKLGKDLIQTIRGVGYKVAKIN